MNLPSGAAGMLLASRFGEDVRAGSGARFDIRGFLMVGCGFAVGTLAGGLCRVVMEKDAAA